MLLKDLFKMNTLRNADDGGGAGAGAANPEGSPQETLNQGAGQVEVIKVGDLEVDPNNPESVKQLANAYKGALTGLTKTNQELAKFKKETPVKKETVETPKQTNVENPILKELLEDKRNRELDSLVAKEKQRYKAEFGEQYDKAEQEFDKLSGGLKNLTLDQKAQVLKGGNLDSIFSRSLMDSMKSSTNKVVTQPNKKTPEQFNEQANLPNTPKETGKPPISSGEDKEYKPTGDFSGAAKRAKAARSLREGNPIK